MEEEKHSELKEIVDYLQGKQIRLSLNLIDIERGLKRLKKKLEEPSEEDRKGEEE